MSSEQHPHHIVTEAARALPEVTLGREHINAAIDQVGQIEQVTGQAVRRVLPLDEQGRARLQQMIEFLENPELLRLADEGHITFGMIKPRTHEAKAGTTLSDEQVARQIHEAVSSPLRVLAAQPFWISPEDAGKFYEHLKSLPVGIFERVAGFMASGAVTGLVLYSEGNQAVQEWRQQMGPTNPQKPSDDGTRDTIRHRFADSIENNVVHGSDSIQNVKVELAFLASQLRKLL